jgi:hypothetical protein
MMMPGGGAQGV